MYLHGSLLCLFLAAVLVEYGCGLETIHTFVGCYNAADPCSSDDLRFNCSGDTVISVQGYAAAFSITWDGTGTECHLPPDPNCFSDINYNVTNLCDNEQTCQLDPCHLFGKVDAVNNCNGSGSKDPNAVRVNYTCNAHSGLSSTTEAGSPSDSTTAGGEEENDLIIIIAVTVSVIVVVVIIVIVLVVILRRKKNLRMKGATTDQSSSSTKEPNRLSHSTHMIDNMDYQTSNDILPNKGFHDNKDETEIVENLEYSSFTDKECPTPSDDRGELGLKQVYYDKDETEIVENLEYSTFNDKESPTLSGNKRGALGLKQVPGHFPANKSFSDPFYDQISGKSAQTHGTVPGYEDVTIEQFQNRNTPNQILKQVNGFMKPELPKKPGKVASNEINSNGGYKGAGHAKQLTAFQISQESPNQANSNKHTSLPKEKGPLGDDYTMVVKQE